MKKLSLALVSLVLTAGTARACGTTEVCADVASTFKAEILPSGIVITWSTSHETTDVERYVVERSGCTIECWSKVGEVDGGGNCTTTAYQLLDIPDSAPYGYRIEVWEPGAESASCQSDTSLN